VTAVARFLINKRLTDIIEQENRNAQSIFANHNFGAMPGYCPRLLRRVRNRRSRYRRPWPFDIHGFDAQMKKTINHIAQKKRTGSPITMVTAYDFPTAQVLDEAGADSVLIGDSVGTNCLGYASEREVTIDDMAHHTSAVCRAVRDAFIVADLPYGCADDAGAAPLHAKRLADCGADCVKVEGWGEKADVIRRLTEEGFTVCAHIGYNPQRHSRPQLFGKDPTQAAELLGGAKALCDAGAKLIVLEMLPNALARKITAQLPIPTIGIGSGNVCDGQVLVVNDLLGMSRRLFKHVHRFANLREKMFEAFKDYIDAVKSREFPGDDNSWK
jgi:3-methyl-2-oxobutanoate hydroxymethyltransferase